MSDEKKIENEAVEKSLEIKAKDKLREDWFGLNPLSKGSIIIIASTTITLVLDLVLVNSVGDISKYAKDLVECFERNVFQFTARMSFDLSVFLSSSLGLSVFSSSLKKETQIKQLKKRNEILEEMVLEDGLTKLLNRRGVQKILNSLCSRARRRKGEIHIIFIDLDNLKYINSRFGHALGGDAAIARVAQAIQETFRDEDASGRYGGDEFVGIFIYPTREAVNLERTKVVEERLQEAISKINALAIPIDNPSVGYEEIPVGVTTAIHVVNLENPIDIELNEASEKMLKLKEDKKKKK